MIKKGGSLNDPIEKMFDKNNDDEKKKEFLTFFINDYDKKVSFIHLPKVVYVYLRDLAGLYDNDLAFCFFHAGLIREYHRMHMGPEKEKMWRITFKNSAPHTTRLRLMVWDTEIESDYLTVYKYLNTTPQIITSQPVTTSEKAAETPNKNVTTKKGQIKRKK
jgi:hypothetical protein